MSPALFKRNVMTSRITWGRSKPNRADLRYARAEATEPKPGMWSAVDR